MSADINLLPSEFKTSKEVLKTSRVLTRFTVVCGAVLIIAALVGGGLLYYLTNQAEQALQKQQELLADVQNLEGSEQRLALMKDRVNKITQLLSDRQEYDLLDKYSNLLSQLPPDASFEEIELDTDLSQITFLVTNSNDLSRILELATDSSKYSLVRVDSLEYSSITGYEVVLDLL